MREKVLVVFNPTAGNRKTSRLHGIVRELESLGASVSIHETTGPGDASHIASECRASDWDAIVAAGGDGTLNEVINGRQEDGPPVGLIPLGTANLAALEIGIVSRAAAIAEMIANGPVRPAYVGSVNDRKFLLMTGVGFDAHVVRSISTRVKRLLGKGAYVLEVMSQLVRYGFPLFDVEIDGVKRPAASLIVANGHYYAGPYICATKASFDQPGLFACIFEKPGPLNVLRYGLNMLLGRLEASSGYLVLPASRIVVQTPREEPFQIDGDSGGVVPMVIEARPNAIPLIRAGGAGRDK
jgi:YegS/Rv2252/BmrU family lipid kinase